MAEGWNVIGFDIERHEYGEHRYPGTLLLYDVHDLHGSWFKDASLIVASPPCQEYSYMAMPWKRAKAKAAAIRADHTGAEVKRLTALFDACFRLQREACEAAGRHIPMVVENVRGAQPWVGKAAGKFGSFYLWGDVPALMPPVYKATKVAGFRFDGNGGSFQSASVAIKNTGGSWFNVAHNTTSGKGRNPVNDGPIITTVFPSSPDGLKGAGPKWCPVTKSGSYGMARWTNPAEGIKGGEARKVGGDSKSSARKMASAMIAKIPEPLSRHIATTFHPDNIGSASLT